jgi:hypothetical protein
MPQLHGLSRSLIAREQDATFIAVIEMGQSAGGGNRAGNRPYFGPGCVTATPTSLSKEAMQAGCRVKRSPSPMRLAATASGWRAGCALVRSTPMSSTRPVYRSRVSTGGQRQIGLTLNFSGAPFSVGCAASQSIAA